MKVSQLWLDVFANLRVYISYYVDIKRDRVIAVETMNPSAEEIDISVRPGWLTKASVSLLFCLGTDMPASNRVLVQAAAIVVDHQMTKLTNESIF